MHVWTSLLRPELDEAQAVDAVETDLEPAGAERLAECPHRMGGQRLVAGVAIALLAGCCLIAAELPGAAWARWPAAVNGTNSAPVVLTATSLPGTGCKNWGSILLSASTVKNSESCRHICDFTMGCVSANYQTQECVEGVAAGTCNLYSGNCEVMDNPCWDLDILSSVHPEDSRLKYKYEHQEPAPPPAPQPAPQPASSSGPWTRTGQGCKNWKDLNIATIKDLSEQECGQTCQSTHTCEAFDYQADNLCSGEGSAGRTCMLFKGGCEPEANDCWKYFELQPGSGYCDLQAPSMKGVPSGADEIAAWARGIVSEMTPPEKKNLVRGFPLEGSKWVGLTAAIPRLGIPSLTMQDGPQGFRTNSRNLIGQVVSWPCSLAVAATWDEKLMNSWAQAMGMEFKAKGANIALGPGVNVARVARNGRNAEYVSGEDPYLGAQMTKAYVEGMQSTGVAAVVKHFVGNDQETSRESVDIRVDERTLWEVYYPPFQAAVDAGVASVMCSYNQVNGRHACSNSQTLTDDLKGTMGFDGWVMTDWWASHDGAADAGTDQDMPKTKHLTDEELGSSGRLDDMAERVLKGMARAWSVDSDGGCRAGCDCEEAYQRSTTPMQGNVQLARELAAQGAVLLKNDAGTLPLKASQTVAVLGSVCEAKHDASYLTDQEADGDWIRGDYYVVGGSGRVVAAGATSVAQGLRRAGMTIQLSGTDDLSDAETALTGAQVAVVCAGAMAHESEDRKTLSLDQEEFVDKVLLKAAAYNVPVVVVGLAPGPVVMPWRQKAAAVLLMFLSGEQTGNAAADLLTGQATPSGKLPVTIPDSELDTIPPCSGKSCEYSEKLRAGWHWYDGKTLAYPFGHGLSYTDFALKASQESVLPDGDGMLRFVVNVENTGDVAGSEVVQLYVRFPLSAGEPDLLLRSFAKTSKLMPGDSQDIALLLTPRDLSTWDVTTHSWMAPGPSTSFEVMIGTSSRDLKLCGIFQIGSTAKLHSGPCV